MTTDTQAPLSAEDIAKRLRAGGLCIRGAAQHINALLKLHRDAADLINAQAARIKELEARAALAAAEAREASMREALQVGWELSTWAACLNWRARDRDNTGEWMDELRSLIQRFQDLRAAALSASPAQGAQQEQGEPLAFTYTNWRGETDVRRAIPIRVYHGSTEWHPDPQWLMEAHDMDKGAVRVFAMKDMGPAQGGDIARELAETLVGWWINHDPFDARLLPAGLVKPTAYELTDKGCEVINEHIKSEAKARAAGLLPTETREEGNG